MQIPLVLDRVPDMAHESGSHFGSTQTGWLLSFESHLRLRSLYEYMDNSRVLLSEIQTLLSLSVSRADIPVNLKRASEKLGVFCLEADSWGFDALFNVAQGLQALLLKSSGLALTDGFWEALHRGLTVLSVLLIQCERDFCWRLATADTLDCLSHAAED
jgi:hypothetical protein